MDLARDRGRRAPAGDRVEIGDEAFLVQGEPVRDRERLVWNARIAASVRVRAP